MKILDEIKLYDRLLSHYPIYGSLRTYLIFIFGGGIRLLLIMMTTVILTEIVKLQYAISYAIALGLAAIFAFAFNRHVTFKKYSKWRRRFMISNMVVVIVGTFNWLLVYVSTETITDIFNAEVSFLYYATVIVLVTFIVSIMNFLLNKKWVFR